MTRFYYERDPWGAHDISPEGFNIHDRLRGSDTKRKIAWCASRDDAERIVDALNAAVRNGD